MDQKPSSFSSLTEITPLSRYLSMVLFIILPFIGFVMGMQYGVVHSLSKQGQENSEFVPIPPAQTSEGDLSNLPSPLEGSGATTTPANGGTTPVPPHPAQNSSCGITNCNGIEITCGEIPPEGLMCNTLYQLGDFCRGYSRCEETDGMCAPVYDSRYERCVSCVSTCAQITDPQKSFECEVDCREQVENS